MMQPLLILTGPTAVGKTDLSLTLAEKMNGEIISADSVQVYRGMDIGSAKIRPDEMRGIRHHLIDILDPDEPFDVVRFQALARTAVSEIAARGKLPIIAGGTGFYIQALLKEIRFEEEDASADCRKRLEEAAEAGEGPRLHESLRRVDPASAEAIHPNNVRRVIRALEFYEKNGYPISEHNRSQAENVSPYRYCYFVLTQDRAVLYERINRRVDGMIEAGLKEETEGLLAKGYGRSLSSMQAIGYKEMAAHLEGEYDFDTAVTLIKRNTRHFAKRQLTWFRRERDVIWLDRDAPGADAAILKEIYTQCRLRGIPLERENE